MECNKHEGIRATKIAEKKLTEDIAGAQKFGLKAKNMFPGLDGISQFLDIIPLPVDLEPEAKSLVVPDSDFHSFANDRMEKCFGGNQGWAAYDPMIACLTIML